LEQQDRIPPTLSKDVAALASSVESLKEEIRQLSSDLASARQDFAEIGQRLDSRIESALHEANRARGKADAVELRFKQHFG
jgi:predicted  nucleic acid-binding Zn-ribbon protein